MTINNYIADILSGTIDVPEILSNVNLYNGVPALTYFTINKSNGLVGRLC